MKVDSQNIIAELERLAEAFPWDVVNLWIGREPEGKVRFTAYIEDNTKFGFGAQFGHGESPALAVDDVMKQASSRDPSIAKAKRIAQLQGEIERLQAVIIGMPPYRPNRELCSVNVPELVEV
jgi:hypothetical protein